VKARELHIVGQRDRPRLAGDRFCLHFGRARTGGQRSEVTLDQRFGMVGVEVAHEAESGVGGVVELGEEGL
jgi:hypothetical protein